MKNVMPFGDVLEAVSNLTLEEQEALLDILRSRLIEQRREQLAQEIREAQQEYQTGSATPTTVDELTTLIQRQENTPVRPFAELHGIWKGIDLSLEEIRAAEYRVPDDII